MSSPSKATFFNGKEEVGQYFTNCGWTFDDDSIKRGLHSTIECSDIPEWTHCIAYGIEFTKEELNNE
jgi:hypothetical protein